MRVYDNPDEPVVFTMEASQDNDKQLALVTQDEGNPDFWNHSKFEVFSKFLGFSTIGMEKEILKFFQNLCTKREKILTKELSENSKFERELKRLHFAINYERVAVPVAKQILQGGKVGLSMNLKIISWNI